MVLLRIEQKSGKVVVGSMLEWGMRDNVPGRPSSSSFGVNVASQDDCLAPSRWLASQEPATKLLN
jgi:hypothetical protein